MEGKGWSIKRSSMQRWVQPNKGTKTFIGFLLTYSIDRAFTRFGLPKIR